ncbi:MAG: hypothetical protein WDM89_19150 [Rhizomicrobium sp.]
MKTFTATLAAAAVAVCAALPAQSAPVCLQTYRIDHTHVVDSKNILFYMKDGKIWHNSLIQACPALNFNGFVMNVSGGADEVCSNMQSIRVSRSGDVCMLGEFTPYTAPPKAM